MAGGGGFREGLWGGRGLELASSGGVTRVKTHTRAPFEGADPKVYFLKTHGFQEASHAVQLAPFPVHSVFF